MKLSPEQAAQFDRDGYQWHQDYGTWLNDDRRHKRPEYIAHRDFTPITLLDDDCLRSHPPVDLLWLNGMPANALVTSLDPIDAPQTQAA